MQAGRKQSCGKTACVYDPPLNCAAAPERNSKNTNVVGKVYGKVGTGTERREIAAMTQARRVVPNLDAYASVLAGTCTTKDGRNQLLMTRSDETLRELVAKKTADPLDVFGKLIRVAEGLAALNAQGISHMDVAPDNVMWRKRDDAFVLVDFGHTKRHELVFSRAHNGFLGIAFPKNPPEFARSLGRRPFSYGKLMPWLRHVDQHAPFPSLWTPADAKAAAPKVDVFALGVLLLWLAEQPFCGRAPKARALFVAAGRKATDPDFRTRPSAQETAQLMRRLMASLGTKTTVR